VVNWEPRGGDWLEGTGWFAIPGSVFENSLSTQARMLLILMYRYSRLDTLPTIEKLANDCAMPAPAIHQAFNELQDQGFWPRGGGANG
jgi:hypothetical protein